MLPDEELVRNRDHLEKLAGERTAELKALNWHLQQQITERKQAEQALERTSKDLQLVNLVNNAANQGYSLPKILQLVVHETKKMFSCNGVTFYEISEDKKYLVMQNLNLSPTVVHQIEKLIGRKIPTVRIRLRKGSLYWKALQAGKPQLINDPGTIRGLMAECTANKLLKKLALRINQLLGIASVMQTPLIAEGEVTGLLDISRKRPFTESELERFATVAQQLLLIIKRKRAEETLQAEKNKLQSVIDAVEHGLTIQDKDYNILYQSQPSVIAGGYHLGQKCYRAYEGRDKVCDDCPVEKAFRDGETHTSERRIVMPSGEVAFWENTASPVRDAEGKIVSCLEVGRDVTERKRAEEALQAEKNKLQSVIDAIEHGLSIQDRDYNILYQSQPSAMTGGYHVGEKCYRVYEGKDKVCDGCPVEQAFKDGKPYTSERRIVLPSGEVVFLENTACPVRDAEGRIVSCLELTRNITERKKAEEALRDATQKWTSLVEHTNDIIIVVDNKSAIQYVNRTIPPVTVDQVIGKTFYDFTAPEYREVVREAAAKVFATGEQVSYESSVKHPSGVLWFETTMIPITEDGKVISAMSFNTNITERKRAEEELQAEKNKLQSVIDAIEYSLTIMDRDYNIIYQSQPSITTGGYYLGEKCYRAFESKETVCDGCPVEQAFKDGKSHTSERRIVLPSGEVQFLENTACPVRDAEGRIVSCLEVTRDITERKRVEGAVRESEEKYRGLVTNVKLGVFRSTPEPAGRFLEVNPAMAEITGYSRKELLKMNVSDLYVNPEKRKVILEEIASGGGKPTREARLKKKDGTEIVISDTKVAVRDDSGKVIYFDGIMEDITERKEAEEREEELQHELYLASRLAAVGELAAGVAHEMNNPLTGIMGFSERLLRKSGDDDAKKDLEIVYSEAQRLAKVVKNLLAFARQREPAKEFADINEIVQTTLELRAYELKSSNIEVALDLTANLPQIMVDFHQIQEVFLNIILNAEQVMAEASGGGKLTIKTRLIKDYIRISFADDGPGIPAKHLDRVFNPFFTTKGERGGTGLGLSVCHGIVTEHGGRIYARSKPGSGATFLVDLPLTSRKIGESQIAKAQLAL